MKLRKLLKRMDLVTAIVRILKCKAMPGGRPHDPSKRTLVIGLHEATLTGAPLLGLNVGKALSGDFNIIYWLGAPGPILEGLKPSAYRILVGFGSPYRMGKTLERVLRRSRASLAGAIANSVESLPLARAMDELEVPTLGLLHEFGEYTLPPTKLLAFALACDRVVVPAELVADSARARVHEHAAGRLSNLVVRHQGALPEIPLSPGAGRLDAQALLDRLGLPSGAPRPPIVLGAGFVHARKGVDLFLQTALSLRKRRSGDFRFVWVGERTKPEEDLDYTFWLEDTLRRTGLETQVKFLPPQQGLGPLLDVCDVFFLPSRLDPFPNVVLDALGHGKPIVCFDRTTGVAEFLRRHQAAASIVAPLDIEAAAEAILGWFTQGPADRNREIARRELDFGDYAGFLREELDRAAGMRRLQKESVDQLRQAGLFDPSFASGHDSTATPRAVLRAYVSAELRGLHAVHPFPGFNALHYRQVSGMAPAQPGITVLHALREHPGQVPTTHSVVHLDRLSTPKQAPGRTALHVHLFYRDLAHEIQALLARSGAVCDLFLSVPEGQGRPHLEDPGWRCLRGQVQVVEVPNRGRDIGPLLTALREPIREGGYTLVGHIHGKRSCHLLRGLGTAWRRFLFEVLIGDRTNLTKVLDLFAQEPRLGLVFPEDRHAIGWGLDREPAQELTSRMPGRVRIPPVPIFPMGTMFWARPQALAPLWNLRLGWEDYPVEPLAEDGTLLHAIERLLPAVAESQGYVWKTLHREGIWR